VPEYNYEHVHLISADPEKTADFYIRLLGAKQLASATLPGGMKMVRLDLGGSLIIISSSRVQPPVYGLDHFGLTTDDLDASVTELKAAGCKFRMEPTEIAPGTRIAFFWTPENVLIELVETREK
jgi:predicted enzyme related to lactoylglutathione lyase